MREKIFSLFTNPSDMTWEQILMNIGVAALLLAGVVYWSCSINSRR